MMNKILIFFILGFIIQPLFSQTNFYQLWTNFAFQAHGKTNSATLMQGYLFFYDIFWTNTKYEIYVIPWETTNTVFTLVMTPPNPKNTIIFVHGYLDHLGNYGEFYHFLLNRNYQIITLDLPGHGLSSGLRTGIGDFFEYATALEAVLQQPFIPKTFIAIGFSTGCSVWIEYLHHHRQEKRIDKLIMVSPLVCIVNWNFALMGYNIIGNLLTEIPRDTKKTTSDNKFLQFIYQKDPLQEKKVHLSWFRAVRNWYERVIRYPKMPDISLLILQGKNDSVVDWQYNIPVIQNLFPRSKSYVVPGEHQLLMETNRLEIYKKLIGFLEDL